MKNKNGFVSSMLFPGIFSALTTALCAVFPPVFVRNIGSLIRVLGKTFGLKSAEIKQFSGIFDQLKDASVIPPLWLLFLVFAVCFAAAFYSTAGGKRRRITVFVVWILLLLPLMLISLWFTHVNDLRFGIVIGSLIRMAMAGAF